MNHYVAQLPFSENTKKDLQAFVDRLLEAPVAYDRIVLFGSYARGEEKVGSDYDILALTKKSVDREIQSEFRSEFEEKHADLLFLSNIEFDASDALLVKQIRKDGVLLWKN